MEKQKAPGSPLSHLHGKSKPIVSFCSKPPSQEFQPGDPQLEDQGAQAERGADDVCEPYALSCPTPGCAKHAGDGIGEESSPILCGLLLPVDALHGFDQRLIELPIMSIGDGRVPY